MAAGALAWIGTLTPLHANPIPSLPRRSSAPRRKGTAKVLEPLRDIPGDEAVTDTEEGWEDTQSPLQPNVGTSWQYRLAIVG